MGARDALSKQQGPLLAGAPIRSAGIEAACGAGDEPASGGVASRERSRVASRSGRAWESRVDGVKDNRGRLLHLVQMCRAPKLNKHAFRCDQNGPPARQSEPDWR